MQIVSTPKKRSVTLKDVALVAGVSASTVSAALHNGVGRYNAETAERIRAIANELGYRPNRSAQSIRTGKNKLIGMIYFGGPLQVANERAHYIGRYVQEQGYELLTLDIHWYNGHLLKAVDRLLEANVNGVIIAGPGISENEIGAVLNREIPVVGISTNETHLFPLVRADMRQGMEQMTQHLLSLGHRRILCLSTAASEEPELSWPWQQRQQNAGVRHAIENCGGKHSFGRAKECLKWLAEKKTKDAITGFTLCHPNEVIYFDPFILARKAIRSIKDGASLPDVVICPNDEWAVGVISELAGMNIRVPEDIAVTGYNDSALSENFPVPITTIRQPIPEMARKTVSLCINAIENRGELEQNHPTFDLPCQLIVKKSCHR